ncbi:MAG: NfeD family protein [Spirochaetaceae bacterium]
MKNSPARARKTHFPLLLFILCIGIVLYAPSPLYTQESKDGKPGKGGDVAEKQAEGYDGAVIPIKGEIDKFQVVFLRRSIEKAKESGAKTLVFSINTFGGRVDSALQMATLIGSLEEIRTVAYIPADPEELGVSWSAGALISFACNEIHMAPGTSIGAAAPVLQTSEGSQAAGEKTVSAVRAQLAALAEKNGYPREVAIAMVDEDTELVEIREDGRYRFELGNGEAAGENGEEEDEETETRRRVLSPTGKLLTLTAGEMEEYGISSGTVSPLSALLKKLEIGSPLHIEPSGFDLIIAYLTSAAITSILLTIGLLALYMEISSPGFGLPGTVAVLAFSTIFISGGLLGTLGSLELILFILGVGLLVVEIFLIPGFGFAGIGGLLLMGTGLLLSRQGFVLPESDWQWDILLENALVIAGTFSLSFILMGILLYFFPQIKLFNRLILSSPRTGSVNTEAYEGTHTGSAGYSFPHDGSPTVASPPGGSPQIGSRGKVKTNLRPAGKMEIDGEDYSVVTEGEWIEPGAEVRVIEVAGNRIVVERSE